MKMIKRMCLFFLVVLISTPLLVSAEELVNSRKTAFAEVIAKGEANGLTFSIDYSSIDYSDLDITALEKKVDTLISLDKDIVLQPPKTAKLSISSYIKTSEIGIFALDEYVETHDAIYSYHGNEDVFGNGFRYNIYMYVDYDCLYDGRTRRPKQIERINDVFSDAADVEVGKPYTQLGFPVKNMSYDRKECSIRGKGKFTIGLDNIGAVSYTVKWRCTVSAGDKGVQ